MTRFAAHGLSLIRLLTQAAFTIALIPVQLGALVLGSRLAATLPVFYHGWVLRIFGIRCEIHGQRAADGPVLFVSNHVSYLDIEILGSLIPGCFVAKREVAGWPVFGPLAKLQRSIFIDRTSRSRTHLQRTVLTDRMTAGDNLILFPEGTSSDGTRLQPFKSALFSTAELRLSGRPVMVQPVTIAYVELNGIPIGRSMRPYFAWYGDMELAGHLWTVVGLGMVKVAVLFHQPVTIDMFGNRKKLAEHCERVIADGLAAANAGRIRPAAFTEPEKMLVTGGSVAPAH